MKKILSLVMILAIVLGLCACGAGGESKKGLQVGFGMEDITPDFSVGMGGMSETVTRKSQGVVSKIYLTCIAFKEGDETVLMYTVDMINAGDGVREKMREAATKGTGVPAEKIFIGTTHTHSAPFYGMSDVPGAKFNTLFLTAVENAGKTAMEDLAPATILMAKKNIEKMNFVRHYIMNDGSYAGSNFGTFTGLTPVGHPAPTEPELLLLKFDRADDKKDILMVNWQGHPAHANSEEIGYYNISADYVGAMRDKLVKETGMQVAYFTGAEGNLGTNTSIPSEDHNLGVMDYGKKMADYAIELINDLKPVEGSGLESTQITYVGKVNHAGEDRLADAKRVKELTDTAGIKEGDTLAKQLGFSSRYEATGIAGRASMGATRELELNAIRIGNIGFVAGTYEMFSEASLYIREHSPYAATFVITANMGYIASEIAFDYKSYEAVTCTFERGTSEALAEKFVELLNGLKAE